MLKPSVVGADNLAFTGTTAQNARGMAERIAGGRDDLAGKVFVGAGVEIRSDANLTLGSDWNLQPVSGSRIGEATTVTLRAAGNLNIANSLSDGFTAAPGASNRSAIAANGVALAVDAASYRLVGGADLTSADVMATVRSATTGDVTIGRAATGNAAPPGVFVRTTTGSIEIAAGHDVQQLNSQARIYTTGTPVAAADMAGFERVGVRVSDQLIRATGGALGPFFENAGAITLSAGNDVVGAPATVYLANGTTQNVQYVTDWWYRQTGTTEADRPVALWSRYDLFSQGFASFGGGNISVHAGRDVVDLDVATPGSGFAVAALGQAGAADYKPAQSRWFSGGVVEVAAGRNVVGGLLLAGGAQANLNAGGSIGGSSEAARSYPAPQLLHGDTAWTVEAAGDITLGSPTNPALLAGAAQGTERSQRTDVIDGLATHASARIVSAAGDVTLVALRPGSVSGSNAGSAAEIVPDELLLAAPQGGITAPVLTQRPVGASTLALLARDSVDVIAVRVPVSVAPADAQPHPLSQVEIDEYYNVFRGEWAGTRVGLDTSDRTPVRLVSEQGSVRFDSLPSFSARPVRLIAHDDVVLDGGPLQVQHQRADELSVLQAGRDVLFTGQGSLRIAGPGDVMVLAARDIDFGRGPGITTVGNQDNPLRLGRGGAGITLLAGVRLSDYADAAQRNFQLLGSGFANFPAELAVQLEALQAGGALLDEATQASAAKAFAALSPEAQRARVRQLVGAAEFDRAAEAYLTRAVAQAEALSLAAAQASESGAVSGGARNDDALPVPGSELLAGSHTLPRGATAAQREAAQAQVRSELREALQTRVVAAVLAARAEALDAAARTSLALAVSPHAEALRSFVALRSGVLLDAAESARRFAALPLEQQALFMNRVLYSELRTAGRAALNGERIAYLRGYDALDGLFDSGRARSNVTLSNSQVKTEQGGDIRIAAPAGGINVGDLAGGGIVKSASELGIVTVAGGSIEASAGLSFEVNQSRVFTLDRGDVLLWSSLGNLDAGRGAKTVVGAPPPVFRINEQGQFVVDTSGSFSGSGIAVLNRDSTLDLYATFGEINSGDAGIQSAGNAFLGAARFVGADNLAVGGVAVGAPPPAPTGGATAGLANSGQDVGRASLKPAESDEEEAKRKRRARRNLLLDFLGFGPERS